MSEVKLKKREVFYTLEKERNDKSVRIPLATYSTYTDALSDGTLITGAWHHKIKRHSNPVFA